MLRFLATKAGRTQILFLPAVFFLSFPMTKHHFSHAFFPFLLTASPPPRSLPFFWMLPILIQAWQGGHFLQHPPLLSIISPDTALDTQQAPSAVGSTAQGSACIDAGEVSTATAAGNFAQNFPCLNRTGLCCHQIPL